MLRCSNNLHPAHRLSFWFPSALKSPNSTVEAGWTGWMTGEIPLATTHRGLGGFCLLFLPPSEASYFNRGGSRTLKSPTSIVEAGCSGWILLGFSPVFSVHSKVSQFDRGGWVDAGESLSLARSTLERHFACPCDAVDV